MRSILKYFLLLVKYTLIGGGMVLIFMIVLSFTSVPYNARLNLGLTEESFEEAPEVIIMLGGDGMPSGDGILRCYYTALTAHKYSDAEIVVAFPATHPDSSDHIRHLTDELILRGIDAGRISMEWHAVNTHEQAQNLSMKYSKKRSLLITSPVHTSRAMAAFVKEGFTQIEGLATFERDVNDDELIFDNQDIMNIDQTALRYNMWSYLKFEIEIAREYTATFYYWLRGWI